MYAMVAGTLAIIYILPRFTKAVPSPLVAIIIMMVITIYGGLPLRTIGDLGEITRTLPIFHLPLVEFSLQTLWIILPYSLTLAIGVFINGIYYRRYD